MTKRPARAGGLRLESNPYRWEASHAGLNTMLTGLWFHAAIGVLGGTEAI
jgi:hypothetical protein